MQVYHLVAISIALDTIHHPTKTAMLNIKYFKKVLDKTENTCYYILVAKDSRFRTE